MTATQFNIFWKANYPETIPIAHYFKHVYPDRWFRIHSLPESQRYATDKDDWNILLNRQNEIITDLIGENANFLLVTGDHSLEGFTQPHVLEEVVSIGKLPFIFLDKINLNTFDPKEYDPGAFYEPMFSEQVWIPKQFDTILKDIADNKLWAFFISVEKKRIIAPYDGGVDFVLENSKTRDHYKEKYRSWLSKEPNGY